MDRLWGEMRPVPEANLHVLGGGERILDGAFEVAYTPGHASHHVSYLHEWHRVRRRCRRGADHRRTR